MTTRPGSEDQPIVAPRQEVSERSEPNRAPGELPVGRWFDQTFAAATDNVACDEALLVRAEDEGGGGPIVRFWELDHPAVVLGASGRIRDEVRVEACRAAGVPIARRSSGGGTVVIGPGALNVTVVLPIAAEPAAFRSVDTAQQSVLERIGAHLRRAGPAVRMLGSGDLTLGGRKFSGSAQRRLRTHFMVHASILYDFELGLIDRFLTIPARQPAYRAGRPHADFVTNLPLARGAISEAVRSIWRTREGSLAQEPALLDLVADLSRRKFRDNGWIERL